MEPFLFTRRGAGDAGVDGGDAPHCSSGGADGLLGSWRVPGGIWPALVTQTKIKAGLEYQGDPNPMTAAVTSARRGAVASAAAAGSAGGTGDGALLLVRSGRLV